MVDRLSNFAVLAALLVASLFATPAAAAPDPVIPPALAELRGFRGRIDYVAHRDGVAGASAVTGTLAVRNGGWTLDERTNGYDLRAGAAGSTLVAGGDTVIVDDVMNADALSNAWATAVGVIATQPIASDDSGSAWTCGALRIFLDATGTRLTGFSEGGAREDVSFVLDGWARSGVLNVPGRLLRLRGGTPDAAFTITAYDVFVATPDQRPDPHDAAAATLMQTQRRTTLLAGPLPIPAAWVETCVSALACLLVLGVFAVAWTRRDAVVGAMCKRLALDPRGWRRAGTAIFVEPDGTLTFDGMRYRVGPHFYNRAALVQCSALFVRVTAPGVPRAVVLPRKFRPIDLGVRPARASGFTLIETLLATGLFAAIVLFAVYPALAAISRADAMAADRARAVVLASNALADEEAIDEYDGGAPQGTATTPTDGLTLTVTVAPGSMPEVSDLDIRVVDARGTVLAHLSSWLGAPVKSPPNSSGGPPGG